MVDGRFRGSIGWWIGSSLGAGTHPWQISRSGLQLFFALFFLTSSWDRLFVKFWSQLGPNLASNLSPKSFQNRSKRPPKSIPNRILFLICFFIDFWSILVPTWSQLVLKIYPRIHPRATKNRSQIASYLWSVFWSIFHRFFIDFRPQNQPKTYQKSIPKSTQKPNSQNIKNL